MGHGYLTVLAYGYVIEIDKIIEACKDDYEKTTDDKDDDCVTSFEDKVILELKNAMYVEVNELDQFFNIIRKSLKKFREKSMNLDKTMAEIELEVTKKFNGDLDELFDHLKSSIEKELKLNNQRDKIRKFLTYFENKVKENGFYLHFEHDRGDVFICIDGKCLDARCGGYAIVDDYKNSPSPATVNKLKEFLGNALTKEQKENDINLMLYAYQC